MGLVFRTGLLLMVVFSCVSGACLEEERYLAASGKHAHGKRDLHVADSELISKGLKSKVDVGLEDTELLEKKFDEKYHHSAGSEHLPKTLSGAEYKGKELLISLEKDMHKIADYDDKDVDGVEDEDMSAILLHLKSLATDKTALSEFLLKLKEEQDEYDEKAKFDSSHKKIAHTEDSILEDEKLAKAYLTIGDDYEKADEKDLKLYLAESLHKMKANPESHSHLIKDDIYLKKTAEDKTHFAEEEYPYYKEDPYFKKVDEIGKSLYLDEKLKGTALDEAHLKKAIDEKSIFHTEEAHSKEKAIESHLAKDSFPSMKAVEGSYHEKKGIDLEKIAGTDKAFAFGKTAEEKAIDEWKAKHKDIFLSGEGYLTDEAFKKAGAHHTEGSIEKAHKEGEIYHKPIEGVVDFAKAHKEGEMFHKAAEGAAKSVDFGKAHEGEKFSYAGREYHADEFLKEARKHAEGSYAYEKAREKAQEDAKINSEGIKKQIDEALAHGVEKALYAPKHYAEGELVGEKFHSVDGKLASDSGKSLHGAKSFHEEGMLEAGKAHTVGKGFALEKEKSLFGDKVAHTDGTIRKISAHGVGSSLAHDAEKSAYDAKAHIDGFFEEEGEHKVKGAIAHKGKEIFEAADHHTDHAFKAHGIGSSLAHDAGKSAYDAKAHIDGFFEEEGEHKAKGAIAHKGKEIYEAADHHIDHTFREEEDHMLHGLDAAAKGHHKEGEEIDKEIGVEKSHGTFHNLRHKFMEMLKKILPLKKCHLVTMRPGELLGIVNCISKSKDPVLCEKFAMCEKKMPARVIAALEKCQKETIPGEMKKCTAYAPLFPSRDIPLKIFQCTAKSVEELVPEEKKEMIDFEECARRVKIEGCERVKWFRARH